jgi:post-segregation antitoxin (ccd killing protein)
MSGEKRMTNKIEHLSLTVPRELSERARNSGINISMVTRNTLVDMLERLENRNPKRTIASAKIQTVRGEKTQSQME